MAGEVVSGWLWKEGASWSSRWRRRWFVLRNDATLSYYTHADGVRKGVVRLGATRVVLDERNGSRRCRGVHKPVLHLYTAGRVYHFEADALETDDGTKSQLELKKWAACLLEASGRKSREFAAAKLIRATWDAFRSGPRFRAVVRTSDAEAEALASSQSAASDANKHKAATRTETHSIENSSERSRKAPAKKKSGASFDFESQAKLLLQRPRTGAASILGRSRIVRNRGLCWQVLLGCAEYTAMAGETVQDTNSISVVVDSASPTVLYARNWEQTARHKHQAYQRRLMQLSELPGCSGEPQDNNGVSKSPSNANSSGSSLSRQVAVEDPLSAAGGHRLQHDQKMAELRREIWNDVNRTFPEDPLFQLPWVQALMRRVLLTWCLSEDNDTARRIGYRQGMNSLLAVLVLVHIHDAEAKGRALRCYFTDVLDITLANRVHEELLRSTNYRFPTQKQREEQEKCRDPRTLSSFFGKIDDSSIDSDVIEAERRSLDFRSFRFRPAGWLLKPDFKRGATSSLAGNTIKRKLRQAKEVLTGEAFHRRWFFLHPESKRLFYFRNAKHAADFFIDTEKESDLNHSEALRPLGSIDLSVVTTIRESEVEDAPFDSAFAFDLISGDRKWTLSAESESAFSCWVHAIVTTLHWENTLGPDILHARSSHLHRKSWVDSSGKATTGLQDDVDVQSEDAQVRNSLLVVESTEMAESQCLRSLCGLLGTLRNSSVGQFSVCELFDYYAEGDARAKSTGVSRFQKEAARTFVGARSSLASAVAGTSKLPLLRLCEHIQYVILKNIDPELYRHFHSLHIEPQVYGLKWLRCLFSNVLTAVDFQDEDDDDEEDLNGEDASGNIPHCKPLFMAATRGPPSDLPLKHVLTVWDAMLGCGDRFFDFVESFCVALLVTIRTPLLEADINETLVLLMRYSLTTVCQTRVQDARRILGTDVNAEALGNVESAVAGLVEVAMQIIAQDDWPDAGGTVSVEQLIQTWIEPVSLQFESSKVRSMVSDRQQRAMSSSSSSRASVEKNYHDLDSELKSVLTLEKPAKSTTGANGSAGKVEEGEETSTGVVSVPLRGKSGGYGVPKKEEEEEEEAGAPPESHP